MEDYLRASQVFEKRLGNRPLPRKLARYLLFRMACPLMQAKLPKLVDLSKVPATFLHGNPHLDNYVKTFRGSAMVDFDRSRLGPYCWDIIRFLSSLSLKREQGQNFLDRRVVEHFIDAYLTHFLHPDIPARDLKMLKNVRPQKWQMNFAEYLQANKKWVKKMREHPLKPKDHFVSALLHGYLASRSEMALLDEYRIEEVGMVLGSFGKKHYIFALVPRNPDSHRDALILDIKEVYQEKDSKFFKSPHAHHGQRMIMASRIFADGMEEGLGFCTVGGKQYWGRHIPTFAVKVKKYLNKSEQCDFAAAVGSELGKGHRKGLVNPSEAGLLEADFQRNFDHYYKISQFLTYELNLAYESMRRKIQLYQEFEVR
jgi:uncharacterized protein (DUF2252 family)